MDGKHVTSLNYTRSHYGEPIESNAALARGHCLPCSTLLYCIYRLSLAVTNLHPIDFRLYPPVNTS